MFTSHTVIQISNLHFEKIGKGVSNMTLTLRNNKHSNLPPKTLSISLEKNSTLCPVSAVLQYLNLTGYTSGPLFKFKSGEPVTHSFFNSSLKSLLNFRGLNTAVYKGQFSDRSGNLCSCNGVPLSVIQNMGRWKSNAFQNYIRLHNFLLEQTVL